MPDQGFTRPLESLEGGFEATSSLRATALLWVHALLFIATLITTTVFGYALVQAFAMHRPLDPEHILEGYALLGHLDPRLSSGLSFSLPLLLILLSHEFGHYFECRRRGLDASLPYFLPSPTLFGTCGAFIRIRSPFYTREGLFDVGIAGPIAGFLALIPFLFLGVALSQVSPVPVNGQVEFGTPLVLHMVEAVFFRGVPVSRILLHPMAMAALGGLFATAINLLPMGQLDGGHILYAVVGARWHRIITTALTVVLAILGFFYWPWWIWAVIMFLFGRRHPLTYDRTPVSPARLVLCAAALMMFVLSVSLIPVRLA
ncbi:MAG: site-2 protease family protein [Acidobacteriaceae bacterium]|nr:site-2 protease family protein [Acidobacteriaceae bacterium]